MGELTPGRPVAATRGRRRPRTVLLLHAASDNSAADHQLEELVGALDRSRYRPVVVLSESGELGPLLEAEGIHVVVSRLATPSGGRPGLRSRWRRASLVRRNARELGELARRRNVSVVHASTPLILAGRAVAREAGVAYLQGLEWEREAPEDLYDRLCAAMPRTAWVLRTRTLAVSHTSAPDLRVARFETWLADLGYDPVVRLRARLRDVPMLTLRAARAKPNLVLTTTAVSAPALAAIRVARRGRVLIVADVMGLHSLEIEQASPPGPARPAMRRAWIALERWMTRRADLVLTVNDRQAALIRRRYRPADVYTLRDAAEEDLLGLEPASRAALGIPERPLAVGFVGSLVCSRLEPLFRAWTELEPRELALVIAGDGPDLERYRKRANAANGHRNAVLLGALPREDALAALRACDVAYSECWSEAGFPAKLFEYMALGMPIVTEDTAQAREVLDDGAALFFRTPAELADRIRRLSADPELRSRLGANARARLLEGHTTATRADELAAILEGRPPTQVKQRRAPSFVSVVVPVRNGEEHLEGQLAGLAAQTYRGPWELLVVDNGSTDGSMTLVERWRDRLPPVRIVDAGARRGLNFARNQGAAAARGDYLAFCDADDVVEPGWLAAIVAAACRADVVAGAIDHERLNDPVIQAWRPRGPVTELPVTHGFLPVVSGGNCGVWADVARDVGWDESFRYGSTDAEFSWRVQLAGHRIAAAGDAVLCQRYRSGLAPMMGQYFRYGRSEPQLYRRFRRYGMPRSSGRECIHAWKLLVRRAPEAMRSVERRGHWLRLLSLRAGRLVGSVRWGVPFP